MPIWYLSTHFFFITSLVFSGFNGNKSDLICLTQHLSNEACITLFVHSVVLARYSLYSLQRFVVDTADSLSGFQSCEQLHQQFCCSARTHICGSAPVCGTMPLSDLRAQVTSDIFKVFNDIVHICEFRVSKWSWLCCLWFIIQFMSFFGNVEVF